MNTYEIVITISMVFVVVFVGLDVVKGVNTDLYTAKGFCLDKDGLYNISEYGDNFLIYSDIINCSNKFDPIIAITGDKVR